MSDLIGKVLLFFCFEKRFGFCIGIKKNLLRIYLQIMSFTLHIMTYALTIIMNKDTIVNCDSIGLW